MRTPLAWFNLVHNKTRSLLAVAGVAFAVILMLMQLGFYRSANKSATLIYDALNFDILLRSPDYKHLVESYSFPRDRLVQAATIPGVAGVSGFYLSSNQWSNLDQERERSILVMGFNPLEPVFQHREIIEQSRLLTVDRQLLIDRMSRAEFGPRSGKRFGDADIGTEVELGSRRVRIAGHFELGTGFAADGAVLLSDHGLCRAQPGRTLNDVSLGLVRLDETHQGGDVEAVAQAIADWLPADVEVLTRERACRDEAYHWVWNTSIGWIFFLGVLLAMVVGTIIVYLILSNDVANHLAEYATLKAMGYTESYLAGIVLQQAVTLALVGFLPGWVVSVWLYSYTRSVARLPINMELRWVMAVLGLTVVMCMVSGLGSMRKLHSANPAELF